MNGYRNYAKNCGLISHTVNFCPKRKKEYTETELSNLPYGEWLLTKKISSLVCVLDRSPNGSPDSQTDLLLLDAPLITKSTSTAGPVPCPQELITNTPKNLLEISMFPNNLSSSIPPQFHGPNYMDLEFVPNRNKENYFLPVPMLSPNNALCPYRPKKQSKPKTYKKQQPRKNFPNTTPVPDSGHILSAKRNAADMDTLETQDSTKKSKGVVDDSDQAAVAGWQPCHFR